MGFVYLEHALVVKGADALSVDGNFIAECGNCVELTVSGQASKVTNNLIGAGYVGASIFAEGHEGLLVSGNNIFPRGKSHVHFKNCNRSSITANRLHGFYPGLIYFEGSNKENIVASNVIRREVEPWGPMQGYNNGKDDLFGLIHLRGDNNMVTSNLFSFNVASGSVTPTGATPTIILVASGTQNFISNNHVVSNITVKNVVLDGSTTDTRILDSGPSGTINQISPATAAIRYTP
jgi:inulin fructotransferase (DFA-I-forming)